MNNNIGVVLIHGAGLGSWIWDDIVINLDILTLAIDFPNRNGSNKSLSIDDYSNSVIKQIELWGVDQFVIVAHSIGGVVGLKVAEHYKDRIKGFVALSAAIPAEGGSYLSCFPGVQKIILGLMIRLMGTKPPEAVLVKGLCNDLTDEKTKMVVEKFTPEALNLYTQECHVNVPEIKSLYIKLTNDKGLSPIIQDACVSNLKNAEIVKLDSGHLAMLSKPKELSDIINQFLKSI